MRIAKGEECDELTDDSEDKVAVSLGRRDRKAHTEAISADRRRETTQKVSVTKQDITDEIFLRNWYVLTTVLGRDDQLNEANRCTHFWAGIAVNQYAKLTKAELQFCPSNRCRLSPLVPAGGERLRAAEVMSSSALWRARGGQPPASVHILFCSAM